MTPESYLNLKITLQAGRVIGMGKLKKPVEASLIRYDMDENNKPFYTAMWIDIKTGKARYAYIGQDEL